MIFLDGEAWPFAAPASGSFAQGAGTSDGAVTAPMPGRVIGVAVEVGETVTKGAPLVVLEAMKMEQALTAPFDGEIAEVRVREGEQVSEGTLLVRMVEAN